MLHIYMKNFPLEENRFFFGPWNIQPIEQGTNVHLLIEFPENCSVYSTENSLVKGASEGGNVHWSGSASELSSLVIYAVTKPPNISSQVIEQCRDFFYGCTGSNLCYRIIVDRLPAELDVDGLSIPGAVFISNTKLEEDDPVTISHEFAHQWWGEQLRSGAKYAPIWTESIAEVYALLFLISHGYKTHVKQHMKKALQLHLWCLKREITIESVKESPHSDSHFALVYGSFVLFYLTLFIVEPLSFDEKALQLSRRKIHHLKDWYELVNLDNSGYSQFVKSPAHFIQKYVLKNKDALKNLVSRGSLAI